MRKTHDVFPDRRWWAFPLVAALVLGGCGDDAPKADPSVELGGIYSTEDAGEVEGAPRDLDGELGQSLAGFDPSLGDIDPSLADLGVLPSRVFALSTAEMRAIFTAEQLAIRECMERAGFDYTPLPFWRPEGGPPEAAGLANARAMWGLAEEEVAQTRGYHSTSNEDRIGIRFDTALGSGSPAPTVTGSPEFMEAYGREDKGTGCSSEAMELSWLAPGAQEPDPAAKNAPAEFARQVESAVDADPEVQAGMDTWRQCMATAGFDVTTPYELASSYMRDPGMDNVVDLVESGADLADIIESSRAGGMGTLEERAQAEPTDEELDAASADYTCQREADLWRTVYSTQLRIETELLGEFLPLLEEYRAYWTATAESAQAYIAAHS